MTKLNQIVAVLNGQKTRTKTAVTDAYHNLKKPGLFAGMIRKYSPKFEDGDTLPDETTRMQLTVEKMIAASRQAWVRLWDLALTQDVANAEATCDLVVSGKTLASNLPVTYLLFLEKQLVDLRTFVSHIPTLDESKDWKWDPNRNCYVAEVEVKFRTVKVPKAQVLYEATKEHPAQVQQYHVDEQVGSWETVHFSSAMPAADKAAMAARVEALIEGCKFAREKANEHTVTSKTVGKALLDYVFGSEAADIKPEETNENDG